MQTKKRVKFGLYCDNIRMGGRVVEGGSLENYCTFTRTLGSNPSPSALKSHVVPNGMRGFLFFLTSRNVKLANVHNLCVPELTTLILWLDAPNKPCSALK